MQHIYLTAPRLAWHIACMANDLSLRGLSAPQRDFVKALVQTGDAALAARAAGVSQAESDEWLENAAVLRATQAEVFRVLRTQGIAVAHATLLNIACDKNVTPSVRVQAANSLLDRAGLAAARAPDAWKPSDRPLSEYTTAELRALVEAAERQAADQAKTVDGTVLRADPDADAAQVSDLV